MSSLNKEWRRRKWEQRVTGVNGAWFHPEADHGTANGYNSYGCRCDACRAAINSYQNGGRRVRQRQENRKARFTNAEGDLEHPNANHGTLNGYQHWGCRCRACRAATSRRHAEVTAKIKTRRFVNADGDLEHPDVTHGTHRAYLKFFCRCRACRSASSAYHSSRQQ